MCRARTESSNRESVYLSWLRVPLSCSASGATFPPTSLGEWWGQQPPSVAKPSFSAGAGPLSVPHGERRRPSSPVRVWSGAKSNLQHPASNFGCSRGPLTLLRGEQHTAALAFPSTGLQHSSRSRLAPSPSETQG